MKYTIEIDTSSKKGTELLQYIRKHSETKVVSIKAWKKITPADVALPNNLFPTDWQWDEYLDRKQAKGKTGEKAFAAIRQKLKSKS